MCSKVKPENPGIDLKAAGPGSERDAGSRLLGAASDHRRLLLLRGAAALLFAFLVFFWPKLTIVGLATLWGGYSLVDGSLALTAAIIGRSGTPRVWLTLIGLAGLVCAAVTLFAIDQVSARLVGLISTWAIVTGAMQTWLAMKLRKSVDRLWVLVLDGLGTLLFGLGLGLWPSLQFEALLWLTGWFAAAVGSLLLALGYWLARSE